MKTEEKVRAAVVSGQFYPEDPRILKKQVQQFLSAAGNVPDPEVRALIVPHAGYDYSGQVAAEAYRLVQDRPFDSVVVIAFLHRVFLPGVFVDDVDFYETPLGRISVDRALANQIRLFHPLLGTVIQGEIKEHSLEVQLPFLQMVIPSLRIVPVYIGIQDEANVSALADAIAKTINNKNILVVVTTDLSHFYSYETASGKDKALIALFEKGNPEAIYEAYVREEAEACGMGPVLTSLRIAKKMKWSGPRLIRYANSGDVTGDRSSVVGYAAMAFKEK